MPPPGPRAAPTQSGAPKAPKVETAQWRKWEGVNIRDARQAIGDTELAWLENAITIGNGRIELLPREGDHVATITETQIATMWGLVISGFSVMICICQDGSIRQITPAGMVTVVAGAGAVTVNAHVSIWQDNPILIVDPVKGYFQWDGTTFSVIDATVVGTSIATFEGRVWIAFGRLITYTAPNTFDDFDPGDGAGSTIITDEAFQGDVRTLVSALEQLWIIGNSAIDALSNVAAVGAPPDVTTSFTITNIVSNLGSFNPASVIGYYRALALIGSTAVYALSGVTPQKISDKIDGLRADGQLGGSVIDAPAAVCAIRNLLPLIFLVHYLGRESVAGPEPVPLIIGFVQGRWFFAFQGRYLRWITSVVVDGVQTAWGTDGAHVYQLFGGGCVPVKYKVRSKLYDFGSAPTEKTMMKLGIEVLGPSDQHPLTVTS